MVSVPWDLRRAFSTMEEGMRYCEGEFLEVAQRHGLCRPSNSVLTLKDILELHASVVSVSRYPNAALKNAIFLLHVWDLSRAQCPKRTQEMWACRPFSSVLTLTITLELHASVLRMLHL